MAKQNKGVFKKVLRYVKKYILLIILSIILAAATVAGTLSIPVIIGQAIDFIISEGNVDFEKILPHLCGFCRHPTHSLCAKNTAKPHL